MERERWLRIKEIYREALARAEQAIALTEGAGLTELAIYEWLGGLREASRAAL